MFPKTIIQRDLHTINQGGGGCCHNYVEKYRHNIYEKSFLFGKVLIAHEITLKCTNCGDIKKKG